ncbi:tryptophan-rich sensory protein [Acidisphaera sp. L21]|uniref:tryptophan-rich sensory protein n=1 Tax=Acidisphaera sp. L21 TaxID=1641851 RepID=UPI00131E0F82|nr:TspO/MBR family protein [Acidisphaera sp. L21]
MDTTRLLGLPPFVAVCALAALSFGMHRMDLALGELGLLWLAIVATIAVFAPACANAAWLAPYLAWVTFAGALNDAVWHMNRRPA